MAAVVDELDRVLPPERLGRYRIVERLGAGGMGEVLLAIRSGAAGFKKPVALKRILPQLAIKPERLRQVQREASLAAMLHHPNCVHVSELEEIDGELLIAMELLFGVNLHELGRRARKAGDALPLGAALRIIADGARGLHAVHSLEGRRGRALGVVHGDVSPQNLFVTDSGVTKLLDFGVSSSLLEPEFRETDEGMLKGKFPYLAPEQFDSGPVDARVDVWALGVTLWETVCDRPLFDRGSPIVTMDSVHSKHIPRISELRPEAPAELDRLVQAALERDVSARLSSTQQLAERLEAILASLPGSTHGDVSALVDRYARKAVRRLKRLALSLTQDARTVSGEVDLSPTIDGVTTPDLDLERLESTRPPRRQAVTRREAPGPEPIPGDATTPSVAPPADATSPNTPRSRLASRKLPQLPSADTGAEDEAPTAVYWEGPTLLQPESALSDGGASGSPAADAPAPREETSAPDEPPPRRAGVDLIWDLVWLAIGAGAGAAASYLLWP